MIKTLTCPKNNNFLHFFFFLWRHTKKDPLQKKPTSRRRRRKDVGIVRSHPWLVHGRTPPPPVLVSMRVRWQKARCLLRRLPFRCSIVVFVAARFFGEYVSNSFTLIIRRIDDDDGRQRQNLTDRLLLSSSSSSSRARATQQVDESDP